MANTRHHPILSYLRQVLGPSASAGVSDADLLRRFVAEHDEAAFELLLWRHAAMVLHVCRQVLGNADAAEDAFQATFLVFVRKAASISRREALGSWLYRVAYRIALKARAHLKKRAFVASDLERLEAPAESDDAGQRDLRRLICEEVDRLPAKYRAPIVACFFEGKTHEEAAKQLGWPRGTVAGRLARARELLRRRLLRRGVAFSMSALLGALSVRPAQAALTGLVDSVIYMAKLLAAGQAASAVVSPVVGALAEGVFQAMYWARMKVFVVVLFVVSLGGAGVTILATQEENRPAKSNQAMSSQVWRSPSAEPTHAGSAQASDDEDEPPPEAMPEEQSPEDAAKLARDTARSRLNLKKLALAMHNYSDTHGHLPPAATMGKNGKALLSWRVELLPFLEQQDLYQQFHRDEPWNSPHNRKLLSKMPAVYAPPGVKTRRPYSTSYQVFVSAGSGERGGLSGGMPGPGMQPGMAGRPPGAGPGGFPGMGRAPGGMAPPGMGGGAGGSSGESAAFIKGVATHFPASIPDGTSNTILIVEAGNPVPWTKPEDLHYASDEALPELGGLFPNVFHAAFADGAIHTLTKNYNEKQMRLAITANDGMPLDFSKIEARSRRRAGVGGNRDAVETWQRKNEELRKELEALHEQVRRLKKEQEIERELAREDPRVKKLKEEHAHMEAELKKLRAEIEALKKSIPSHKPRREQE